MTFIVYVLSSDAYRMGSIITFLKQLKKISAVLDSAVPLTCDPGATANGLWCRRKPRCASI